MSDDSIFGPNHFGKNPMEINVLQVSSVALIASWAWVRLRNHTHTPSVQHLLGRIILKKSLFRFAVSGSLFGVVTACSTPLEQCNASATQEYRSLIAASNEAQDNISRGYAVHTTSVPYTVHQTCYRNDPITFALIPYSCPQTHYRKQSTPVAIDVAQERQKLKRLRSQLPEAEKRAQAGLVQCSARYSE